MELLVLRDLLDHSHPLLSSIRSLLIHGISSLLLLLVACGGGGGGGSSLNLPDPTPIPEPPTGVEISSEANDLTLTVTFPRLTLSPGESTQLLPAIEGSGTSSIPFGTEQLIVTATSQTASLPYEATIELTPAEPSGTFEAVPQAATILIVAEALVDIDPVALGETRILPTDPGSVRLQLTPAAGVPQLTGVFPEQVRVGESIILQGQNLAALRQVIFSATGDEPPIVVEVFGPTAIVPVDAVSGPVVGLNVNNIGVGAVELEVLPATPPPTMTPIPTVPPTAIPTATPMPLITMLQIPVATTLTGGVNQFVVTPGFTDDPPPTLSVEGFTLRGLAFSGSTLYPIQFNAFGGENTLDVAAGTIITFSEPLPENAVVTLTDFNGIVLQTLEPIIP